MSLYEIDELHIDDFNKDAAKVLVFLYNFFPRKMELYIEDISGPDIADDYGLHSARHLACMSAIIWLAEEGLIRYESLVKQESFDQAVLTKKSYILLSNVIQSDIFNEDEVHTQTEIPESVYREMHTRIAAIKKALKSGSSEKLKRVMFHFIQQSEASK